MKKRLTLVIAAFAVLAMSAVSFAANTASISVTSEPIRENATCDKAGGFAITFDNGTQFKGGDQITFDLDFGVTLCRDIDLEVGINGNIAGPHASAFTESYTLVPLGGAGSPLTGDGTLGSNARGVIFKITGTDGSQRVTINIMSDINGDGTLESNNTALLSFAGTDVTDELELAFLDQATYATAAGDAGIFAPDANGIYDGNDATAAQNTLCIDVSSDTFTETTVDANYDSKADKYTWIPSNPQIAHVVSASSFVFEDCKGQVKGYIPEPGSATQTAAATCAVIDNERDGAAGGFCNNVAADEHQNNNVIIRTANNTAFDADNYQVELEILVNGQSGANGVYWTNENVRAEGYSIEDDACDYVDGAGVDLGAATATLADGTSATLIADDTDCTLADSAKAVKLVTAASTLGLDGVDDDYLVIDLPAMHKDSTLNVGDVVSVKVTILRAPCGELFTGTWEIATVGCSSASVSNTLRYPYFAKTGSYANALVITNVSGTAGDAAITIYEADGDIFTATVSVGSNSVFTGLLSGLTLTQTAGTGTFGDARAYVVVTTDFSADGAAMITNPATGESIGYLPRQL